MYWAKDARYTAGGFWRCPERHNALRRGNPKRLATANAYWHRADGGYIRRRRRQLAERRTQILDQLATLREEEQQC